MQLTRLYRERIPATENGNDRYCPVYYISYISAHMRHQHAIKYSEARG